MATLFPDAVASLSAAGSLSSLAALCDQQEVAAGGLTQDWPFAAHLLSHAFDTQLARLLWRRIPTSVKSSHLELQTVWALIVALSSRDFCALAASFASPFSPSLQPLVASVATKHREQTMHLLSSSHATASLAGVATALALSQPEALAGERVRSFRQLSSLPCLPASCSIAEERHASHTLAHALPSGDRCRLAPRRREVARSCAAAEERRRRGQRLCRRCVAQDAHGLRVEQRRLERGERRGKEETRGT